MSVWVHLFFFALSWRLDSIPDRHSNSAASQSFSLLMRLLLLGVGVEAGFEGCEEDLLGTD